VATFDQAHASSDGGAILLKAADRRLDLTRRLAACLSDPRDPARVTHALTDMVAQRVFGIASPQAQPARPERPEAMELVAERLAAFVNQHVTLPAGPPPGWRIEEQEITNAGDTVVMLDVPVGQALYPPERAVISRVLGRDDTAWRSDRTSDVLVLGDSFANIYSQASMGWGDSAGLVEHLSYALGRPADRILQNDDGAVATRELLQRAGPERLAGKRVVIWQFAARELAFGDWKVGF
jgi:hypothetical protein